MMRSLIAGAAAISMLLVGACGLTSSDDGTERVSRIPPIVWEGGATVTIDVTATAECEVLVSLSEDVYDEATEDFTRGRALEARETVDAGTHRFTLDVPYGVSSYLEVKLPDPPANAGLGWSIAVDGQQVWEQSDRLDGELDPRYAFFLNVEFDDLAAGRLVSGGLWD